MTDKSHECPPHLTEAILLNRVLVNIDNRLKTLSTKLEKIMATQVELAKTLQAYIDQNAETAAKLEEALAELAGFPALVTQLQATNATQSAQLSDLQAQIDALTASGTGAVTPELQAVVDALVASNAALSSQAAALADVVPNLPVPPTTEEPQA